MTDKIYEMGTRVLEAWGKFWLILEKHDVDMPSYIEGMAKGTIKKHNQYLLRQVKPLNEPYGWYYADDRNKQPIDKAEMLKAKRFGRNLNYIAGFTDTPFYVL